MKIGDRIRFLRIKEGLTQAELARRVGIGQSTLSDYEKNTLGVSDKMKKKFAEAFGIEASDFLKEENLVKPKKEKDEMVVRDLLNYLIESKVITDPDNIDKHTLDMIISAIKKDISNKLKKQL